MPSTPTPVTALAGKEVFTADGARVGRVVDVVVDLQRSQAIALALGDVAEGTIGGLPSGASGVRIPFRLVRGIGDVVVLAAAADEAALPLPGSRDGADGAAGVGGTASPEDRRAETTDGGDRKGGSDRAAGDNRADTGDRGDGDPIV